ncbi:hypothetical protein N7540_004487 [Penicillium herquei]|nr:hypothetical protein N7540_004487 [Penicillium herquei]
MPDITVFPEVPLYLKSCISFWQYLAHGQIDLVYPPYKKNYDGKIIVIPGEVFCRVADCKHGRSPIFATRHVRSHLRAHGFDVEEAKKGRLNKAEMNGIVQWFERLMKNHENKKDEDGEKKGNEAEDIKEQNDNEEEEDEEETA